MRFGQREGAVSANGPRPAAIRREMLTKIAWAAAWLIAGVILTLLFLAYRQPGLLIDFVNLRYCG
jgi:hypothetical protein